MFKLLTAIGLALTIGSGPALAAKAKLAKQSAAQAKPPSESRAPVAPRRAGPAAWSPTCSRDNPCPPLNFY